MKSMNDEEFDNWKGSVRCRWLDCAGGMGLAGNGQCFLGGEWNRKDCPKFVTDEEFLRRHDATKKD